MKKRIALLLAVLLVFSVFMASCTKTSDGGATPDNTVTPSDGGSGGLEWPGPAEIDNEISPVPAGALDFSDGNLDYMAINLSPGDSDPSELSIVDYNGGKALQVTVMENGRPYIGIDISSMFGDKVADIRTIETRILTQNPDGLFNAVSGKLLVYTGADNTENQFLWGVALEKNNPRTLTAELGADIAFVPDAKNIITLAVSDDAGVRNGLNASNLLIDYIAFYDAAGNPMTPDTTVSFVAPAGFGSSDRSFLYAVEDEKKFDLSKNQEGGTSSGWGQAVKLVKGEGGFDLEDLKPGSVITVSYKSEIVPDLIFQSWAPGEGVNGWANEIKPIGNLSGNLVQFTYEDIVARFGTDDFEEYLDVIYVGDWGCDLEVKSVTIGQRVEDLFDCQPAYLKGRSGFIDISYMNCASGDFTPFVSLSSWKLNFRANTTIPPLEGENATGDFKPEWLVPGAYITTYYESEDGTQFCLQRYETKEVAVAPQVWAGCESDYRNPTLGFDQVSAESLLAAWDNNGGGEITEELNAFWIQNRGSPMTLFKVILYTPNP